MPSGSARGQAAPIRRRFDGDRMTRAETSYRNLVDLLYQSAYEPGAFDGFLTCLARQTRSCQAGTSLGGPKGLCVCAWEGMDPHWRRQYDEHFGRLHVLNKGLHLLVVP